MSFAEEMSGKVAGTRMCPNPKHTNKNDLCWFMTGLKNGKYISGGGTYYEPAKYEDTRVWNLGRFQTWLYNSSSEYSQAFSIVVDADGDVFECSADRVSFRVKKPEIV